jgi:hypothetical protein
VLASREALLLGGGYDFTVYQEGRGRVVEDGVEPKDIRHQGKRLSEKRFSRNDSGQQRYRGTSAVAKKTGKRC